MNSFGNNLIMSVFELKLFHIITTEEILSLKNSQYVGNKGKSANLKTDISIKQVTSNFPKNELSYPLIRTCAWCVSGGKTCSFFGKIDMLCFIKTTVLGFALLPYYRQIVNFLLPLEFNSLLHDHYSHIRMVSRLQEKGFELEGLLT